MEEKEELFYINADRTVLTSTDNELLCSQFGALTPLKREQVELLYYTYKTVIAEGKGWKTGERVFPLLDEAVEKTWVRVDPIDEEELRWRVRSHHFKDIILSNAEANQIMISEEFQLFSREIRAVQNRIDPKKYAPIGNACISYVLAKLEEQYPGKYNLTEPV